MFNNPKRNKIAHKGKKRTLTTRIEKSDHCWEIPFIFHGFITKDEITKRIRELVQQYRTERNEKQPMVDLVWKKGKDGKRHLTLWIKKVY